MVIGGGFAFGHQYRRYRAIEVTMASMMVISDTDIDCADSECPENTICDIGKTCQSGTCQVVTAEICTNGIDDADVDTDIDCADSGDCPEGTHL